MTVKSLREKCKRLESEVHWYRERYKLLVLEQARFGEGKERTLLCDILANGQMLPDLDGTRYPTPIANRNKNGEYNCPPVCQQCHRVHRGPCLDTRPDSNSLKL